MTQENTKLCDFSNTNNNDFIGTPIAPPATSAESCDINTALLNLVMKDQFFGTPNEDASSHLNTFVELCNMQKKKDVDNDVMKMKLFPFYPPLFFVRRFLARSVFECNLVVWSS